MQIWESMYCPVAKYLFPFMRKQKVSAEKT